MKDLRKLAEERLDEYDQKHPYNGNNNYLYTIDEIIEFALFFHEQASRDMYPKEFIEWKDENYYYSFEIYWERVKTMIDITKVKKFYSLDELYQYYLTNIKNK